MRGYEAEPLQKSQPSGAMNFATVPLAEVPAVRPTAGASADRPMVLVVDEPAVADTVAEILNRNGYAAIASYDAKDALETALLMPPELVIADVELAGMSGIEVANVVTEHLPDCKVLLLSGPDGAGERQRLAEGALRGVGLIDRPIQSAELLKQVSARLKAR